MSQPLVSVIMPAYNCQEYVEGALRSLMNQTYKNIEIIIVDDCSTDDSWKIIKRLAKEDTRIKPYRNSVNLKISKTLNFAITKAKGVYLARMDSDDERVLDSIEKQVAFLESNPEVVIVGGSSEVCDSDMRKLNVREYLLNDESIRKKLFRFSPFTHATIVMRAASVPSDPYKLDWAEDYDLYFRLGNVGKFANLDTVVYKIRTHKQSVSQSKARYQEKLTLYIRLKAVFEYGYSMSGSDKLYFVVQAATMYLMPPRFRFWLFNHIRSLLK